MIARLLVFIAILGLIDWYAFQALKTVTKTRWILNLHIAMSVFVVFFMVYQIFVFDRSQGQTAQSMLALGLFLLLFIPKILIGLVLFCEDLARLIFGSIRYFATAEKPDYFLPQRREFISKIALGLAAIPFSAFVYGMTKGKYNFKVIKQTLFFDDLPDDFDGFTFTQISDIHSGSFDDSEKIAEAITLINEQESDLFLFTGDIVNTHAEEMTPWIETFKKIKNYTYGKFSVLGNHDYGEYATWASQKAKQENFEAIKNLHPKVGFKLLLNESIKIKKGNSEISIIGVENWGAKFKKAGDLNKAAHDLNSKDFKILMSHDPSHWDAEVKDHTKHFHLMLAGHTHGLQMGIEIPGIFKWSPVQYVYKQWAGLYEDNKKYIYVNRGFGFHAYPGRVGIWPEITVITLKKSKKLA
jgi:uncharacterized protein